MTTLTSLPNVRDIKQSFAELLHLPKEESKNGRNLLLKIFKNILENPNNTKYHDLNLIKVENKLSNCLPFMDLLINAGFNKSNNNQRLIFNQTKLDQLQIINELLLNHESAIELLKLIKHGLTMNEAKATIKITNINNNVQYTDIKTNKTDDKNIRLPIDELLEIGFNENSASIALSVCNNDVNKSVKLLLSQQLLSQHHEFDCNDTQNVKQLNGLTVKLNQSATNKSVINSSYLYDELNITNQTSDANKCKLSECKALQRIIHTLQRYHLYIEQQQKTDGNDEQINYLSDNYDNVNVLNDFNHLSFIHSNEFEDIYNTLISKANNCKICQISKCLLIKRNQRNRSIENMRVYYHAHDTNNVIKQQLMDKIHSYYFHSFDCGYKISRKDKENINTEIKTNENDIDCDDYIFDRNVYSIYNIFESKRNFYSNMRDLNRLNGLNRKFKTEIDEKQNENQYNFGVRYFYWKRYENYNGVRDPIHLFVNMDASSPAIANSDCSKLSYWYISAKYDNFKQELLCNEICSVSMPSLDILMKKTKHYIKTDHVRGIFCARKDSAIYYEMQYRQQMSINHLIAIMTYCNLDELQYKFSETYRKKNSAESDEEMKARHSNYYYLGRLLRECVECFGQKTHGLPRDINLYHGVNQHFTFESLNAFIRGPFSTTTDFSVAVNFCKNKGMILNFNMHTVHWLFKYNEGIDALLRLNCFDCHWISDYVAEQEMFLIGGLNALTFNTIIEAPKGINYYKYVNGLKQMTYCMTNGDSKMYINNIASSDEEKQIVFRLLSHELHRNCPNNQDAHQFKGCPDYFKNILHQHCQRIKYIEFRNRKNKKESELHQVLFKYDNEWIKLDLLLKIFPNTEVISYNAGQKNISFLKQLSIYNSIQEFIKNNKDTKLKRIQIDINPLFSEQMRMYIASYKNNFIKYLWNIYVDDINLVKGLNLPFMDQSPLKGARIVIESMGYKYIAIC